MSLSALLVNTCTVSVPTYGQSATSAGLPNSTPSSTTGVRCNVQTTSGRDFIQLGRETGRRFFDIYFLPDQAIGIDYRISSITGGSIAGLSGVTLRVVSPAQDHSGRGSYKMVTAEELES